MNDELTSRELELRMHKLELNRRAEHFECLISREKEMTPYQLQGHKLLGRSTGCHSLNRVRSGKPDKLFRCSWVRCSQRSSASGTKRASALGILDRGCFAYGSGHEAHPNCAF